MTTTPTALVRADAPAARAPADGGRARRLGKRLARAVPALVVLGLVLVANALPLTGVVDGSPRATYAGLTVEQETSLLPGLPLADPNAGWVTEALGGSAARQLLDGRAPWWDPNVGLGAPLAGDMQSAAFFPLTPLLALPHGAVVLRVVLEAATALATLALLRRLDVRPAFAVPAAVALGLCGTAAWFAHGPALVLPSLPLALLGVERARTAAVRTRRGGVALLAAALALSLVAGFPETAFLDGLLVAAWSLARGPWRDPAAARRFCARLGLALLLGLALAAPALLAFVRLLALADPGLHTGDGFTGVHLPLEGLPMLLLPYVHGPLFAGVEAAPALGPVTGSLGGYVPPGLLVLALLGLPGRRLRALRLALAVTALVLLGRTAGVPVVTPLVDGLPLMPLTAVDRYASPVLSAAAVVLAALGLEDLARGLLRRRTVLVAAGAVVALVVVAGGIAARLPVVGPPSALLRTSLAVSLAWGLLVVVALAVALLTGRRGRAVAVGVLTVETLVLFALPQLSAPRDVRLDTELVAFLQAQPSTSRSYSPVALHANYGTSYGVRTLQYTDALFPLDYLAVREGLRATAEEGGPRPVLEDVVARADAWRDAAVDLLVVPRGTPVPPGATGLLAQVAQTPLADVHRLQGSTPLWSTGAADCAVVPRGPLEVQVRCARATRLVHRSLWLPGWTAHVDGTATPARQDGSWVAVDLPAGASHVALSWAPPGGRAALALAALALGATAATAVAGRQRGRVAPSTTRAEGGVS